MLVVPVIKGNVEKALKQFKRKFKQTGILKEIRKNKHNIKKSTKRKLEKEKAILRRKYKEENDE